MKESELFAMLYIVALTILLLVGLSVNCNALLLLIAFVIAVFCKKAMFRITFVLLMLLLLFVYL